MPAASSVHAEKANPRLGSSFLDFSLWRKSGQNTENMENTDAELNHLLEAFPGVSVEVARKTLEDSNGDYLACAKALLEVTRKEAAALADWEMIDKGMDREDKDDWELVSGKLAAKPSPPPPEPTPEPVLESRLSPPPVITGMEEDVEEEEEEEEVAPLSEQPGNTKLCMPSVPYAVAVVTGEPIPAEYDLYPEELESKPSKELKIDLRELVAEQKENFGSKRKGRAVRERRLQSRPFKAKICYGLACQG
mmetsp:Transcript_33815/g.40873  ORF Transcript_33815/g.40873 Transcript_33815/m.40873 type:complete len:250 (+) Transcript_33815:559-1308(+)|eukprot:CAMPEP_0197855162 /NCGR_PEP_ID=MMETSP1438-20131217/26107_1 /TAXON_ID=1461541 /ORGANISM="Pterosperma sp., Strain CCMP1384" /LENGTH=249 /DNA_ID=CAMNT_0043470167 /DNA_START=559 /DNA_END=1308 /DNA_ORIENTATION=-